MLNTEPDQVENIYNSHKHTRTIGAKGKPYSERRFPWQHLLVDPIRSSYHGLEKFPRSSSRREKKQ